VAAVVEAPALASVPAVEALVECQEVGARELADLALAAGRAQRVNQEAFGKVAVVPAPEEVWEPVVRRVVDQGVVLAGQVRAPAVPEVVLEAVPEVVLEAVPEAVLEVVPEAVPEAAVLVEEPALAAAGLGLALAAGRGLAAGALAPVAELAELASGKPLEGG